jgi:chaperonin GroEL (HSP60 family)
MKKSLTGRWRHDRGGIVESFQVARWALQSAASIGPLVLTTETLIANKSDPKQNAGGGGGYDRMVSHSGFV